MSASKFQEASYGYCTTFKACRHESDYLVLYDYVGMGQLLRRSCWNEEEPVRVDKNTVHIFMPKQLHVLRVRCLLCIMDVTAQKGCIWCFPARLR